MLACVRRGSRALGERQAAQRDGRQVARPHEVAGLRQSIAVGEVAAEEDRHRRARIDGRVLDDGVEVIEMKPIVERVCVDEAN